MGLNVNMGITQGIGQGKSVVVVQKVLGIAQCVCVCSPVRTPCLLA